jgi:hypothetical protein
MVLRLYYSKDMEPFTTSCYLGNSVAATAPCDIETTMFDGNVAVG